MVLVLHECETPIACWIVRVLQEIHVLHPLSLGMELVQELLSGHVLGDVADEDAASVLGDGDADLLALHLHRPRGSQGFRGLRRIPAREIRSKSKSLVFTGKFIFH